MKLFIILLLFSGILLVIQGIYTDKLKKTQENVKVEYRFVPRTYYDDMVLNKQFQIITDDLFNTEDILYNNNVSKK